MAFHVLSSRRAIGGGMAGVPNPIPFEAIDRYAAREGYRGDGWWWFLHLIIAMDTEYLERHAADAERRSREHAHRS